MAGVEDTSMPATPEAEALGVLIVVDNVPRLSITGAALAYFRSLRLETDRISPHPHGRSGSCTAGS
jgi:hypothetical protein